MVRGGQFGGKLRREIAGPEGRGEGRKDRKRGEQSKRSDKS